MYIISGDKRILRHSSAAKTLALKVGAPVIVIRNIKGVYNGTMGTVHALEEDRPVVNFKGKLIKVTRTDVDVYDVKLERSLATRQQIPVKLAFAMTVHRSQGMTLQKAVIDCFSMFAPGQLGVAVSRVCSSRDLQIVNFNSSAARLKHPEKVYDFYGEESVEPRDDLSCCLGFHQDESHSTDDDGEDDDDDGNDATPATSTRPCMNIDPLLPCPWQLEPFLYENSKTSFMPANLSQEFKEGLKRQADFLYSKLQALSDKELKTGEVFLHFYRSVNTFLTSDDHLSRFGSLNDSAKPQKLSTKLMFWLINQNLERRAEVISAQQQNIPKHDIDISSEALRSKVRYLNGACINKICERLKTDVNRKLHAVKRSSRLQRQSQYEKYNLLKSLIISEDEASKTIQFPSSFKEIKHKQGPTRGLKNVSDDVMLYSWIFMR